MLRKDEAVAMLLRLFDDNRLSFREINLLRQVFDEAVDICDQERGNIEADYHMGRCGHPELPSRETEDDFYAGIEADAKHELAQKGIHTSDRAIAAIADIIVEKAEYDIQDFYYTP